MAIRGRSDPMTFVKHFFRGTALAVIMAAAGPLIAPNLPLMGAATAQAQVIRLIDVRGNTRVEDETIRAYLSVKPGERADAFSIDDSLKALFATGLFKDVSIERRGSTLVVTVVENPVINRVAFEGNKKINDESLAQVVGSKQRGVLTQSRVETDIQRILEVYRRSGRFGATVTPKIIDRSSNRVDLVYEIDEGAETGISRITFIGNHAFSDSRLQNVIRTKEAGFLSFIRTTDTYDPDRLRADQESLRQFYLKNGYADFQIISAVADLDRERNVFFITFTIDEGDQYTFSDVEIESNIPDVDPESLRDLLRVEPGDTYSSLLVDRTVEDITIELAKAGYAFATVRPRGDRNFEDRTIALTLSIDEGARVFIERINIRGNTRTRDYVIRREFDISEGDAFNRALVNRAERRLRNLRFFKTVNITTQPGSSPDRIILDVQVEDDSTGSFSVGAGYSTSDGVIGQVSLSERNFLGRGHLVNASVGFGESQQTYNFGFTEPYFLGRRLSAGFDVYRRELGDNNSRNFEQEETGGGIRFGLPITDHVRVNVGYGIEQRELTNDGSTSQSVIQADAEGETIKSSLNWSIIYNTIDNIQKPTNGVFVRLNQEFAGVGGDVQFLSTTFDARYYRELSAEWELVGFLRVQGGHIFGWGGDDVRLLDAFQRGGNLVRGFESSGLGARDGNDALGATSYYGATAEVQFPLPYLPKELGFGGAFFADVGTAFGTDFSGGNVQDSESLRASVGGSLLWQSPFGPLRVDIAYPLLEEDFDETELIRFGASTAF